MLRRNRWDLTRRTPAGQGAAADDRPAAERPERTDLEGTSTADTDAGDTDDVDLDGPDNAWWSRRELDAAWAPPPPAVDRPVDPLEVHLGPQWQHTFGLDDPAAALPPEATRQVATGAPDTTAYAVLGVDPSASWEDIVAAHRSAVRRHHPDRVAGDDHDPEERARAEESIIAVNEAFGELRTRRGH